MELKRKQESSYQDKVIKFLDEAPDNIKFRHYTEFEDEMIRKYYHLKGPEALAKALNRSKAGIRNRAFILGVKR